MNTSCKANTELSHCIWNNSCNHNLLKIRKADLTTKGFLSFLPNNCKKQVKDRRKQSVVLSMSTSGIKGDGLTYKDAGVDIDAGSELVRRIAKMAPGIGGFGGLFPLGMNAVFIIIIFYNRAVAILYAKLDKLLYLIAMLLLLLSRSKFK